MQDHLRQVGRTAEWRRDPRPDEDDMAVDRSQVGALHPEDHAANPLRMEKDARTAFDVKDVHRRLSNLTDNVLKQILILPEGTHLTPGQTYLDRFVAKHDVDYQTWNVLLGIDNPERTGQAGER
jgi:hypothetical protein